jgi:hypothetical protein
VAPLVAAFDGTVRAVERGASLSARDIVRAQPGLHRPHVEDALALLVDQGVLAPGVGDGLVAGPERQALASLAARCRATASATRVRSRVDA